MKDLSVLLLIDNKNGLFNDEKFVHLFG